MAKSVSKKPHLHQDWIDPNAMEVIENLQKNHFTTYLVGGCVRDLLLNIHPKDYDIATSAQPNEVRKHIRQSYVIGKRFRLVLVKRGREQYEVSTFRREIEDHEDQEILPEGDNVFGSPEQDAQRRDFTVNSLFYDPIGDTLLDFCDGARDLELRLVRMIGDPMVRLKEDPIRILRALRLAHLIGFMIEPELRHGMITQAETLADTALPRRREEFLKLLRLKDPSLAFLEAFDLGILKVTSPHLHACMESEEKAEVFLHHLRYFHDKWLDRSSPIELFGCLILAYYRSVIDEDPFHPIRAKDIMEHELVLPLMKDELGMFKFEQSQVAKALHMQTTLNKRSEFERRGERRQKAVLKTEAFPLALKMAERDYAISSPDLMFWFNEFHKALPEILVMNEKKRRPPRRKKRPRSTQKKSN